MHPKFLYLTLLTLCAFANGPSKSIASNNAPPALTHPNIRFLAITHTTTTTTTRAATTTTTPIVCGEICPAIFLPVCGSDLKTYSNECLLNISDCNRRKAGRTGVTVLHTGACYKDTTTTTTTAAVISTHATRPHTTTTAATTTATNTCGHSASDCYPLEPFQARFFDLSCALTPPYAGGLGCNAAGMKCCRFCGFGVYLPCPGTTSTTTTTVTPTETTTTTTEGTQTTTAAPSTTATPAVCPAGCLSWFDGCNTCICSETGGLGGCTRMFCEVTQPSKCLEFRSTTPAPTTTAEATTTTELSTSSTPTPTTTAATTVPVTEVCPPGCVSWFDGCNTCTCGEVMACTLKFCSETQPAMCLSFESTSAPASTSVPTTTTTETSVPPTTEAPPTTTAAVATTTVSVVSQTGTSTTPSPVCPESCLIWFDGCVSCPCVATGVLGQCAAVLCPPEQQPATCMEFETTTITSPPTPMPTSEAATTGSEEQPSPGPSEPPTDGSGCCYEIGFGAFMVPVYGPATDVQSETECPEEERIGGATRFQPGMTCAEFYASVGAEIPTTTETPMTEAPTTTPSPTTEPETTSSPPVMACPQGCVVWYDGCNMCVCDGAGKLGTCTHHVCVWHAPEECMTFQNQTLTETETETTTPIPTTPSSSAEIPDPAPGCCYFESGFGPSNTQFVGPASDVQSETDCPVSSTIRFQPNMTCAEFYASIGAEMPATPLLTTTPTEPSI